MTCEEEIRECARRIVHQTGRNEFTVREVVRCMKLRGTHHDERTIRASIRSKMCANCPKTNGGTTEELERIRPGVYRLTSPGI